MNNIDARGLVKKTNFNTKITELENKIPDTSGLVKKTGFNTKVTEIEGKLPSISGLAINTVLTAVENEIPDVSILVNKAKYNTKICAIEKKLTDHNHEKYNTTPEFITMVASAFNGRLAQANLITNTDFDTKLSSRKRKFFWNKQTIYILKISLKS